VTPRDRFFIEFWLIPDGVLTFAYLALAQVVHLYLRARYPEVWERLGRMTLFANNRPGNVWRFLKFFIFSTEYKTLGDGRLERYALWLRVVFWACATGLAAGIALVFTPER
jgi:hypothetical protein